MLTSIVIFFGVVAALVALLISRSKPTSLKESTYEVPYKLEPAPVVAEPEISAPVVAAAAPVKKTRAKKNTPAITAKKPTTRKPKVTAVK